MHQRGLISRERPLGSAAGVEKGFKKSASDSVNAHAYPLLDTTAMIRSLQRAEGLDDCYRRGHTVCPQGECPWRRYCLTP